MQTPDDSTSEGVSVFMIGGGCPERTEAVSLVAPFLYSLQVYVDLLKVWLYNTLNVALHELYVVLSVYLYYSCLIHCNNCVVLL